MKKEWRDSHEGQKAVTLWFDEKLITRLDRLAEKGDVPRARLIRNLTEVGVEYLEACQRFGILQTAVVIRNFSEKAKEWCKDGIPEDLEKA